jgi:hypothetical protein
VVSASWFARVAILVCTPELGSYPDKA